jgi:hypothetical protein
MATQYNTLTEILNSSYGDFNVAIIGAGGIGSHFCRILHKLIEGRQFSKTTYGHNNTAELVDVYDFDSVSESNLKHQDFLPGEVFAPKCMIMGIRYGYKPVCERFSAHHLDKYQLYIICADNPGVRAMVYRHVDEYNRKKGVGQKFFIDMRSEGDMVAVFTNKAPLKDLLESLGDEESQNSVAGRSCQLVADTTAGRIQLGNFLVPVLGATVLLKMARGENYPASIIQSVV